MNDNPVGHLDCATTLAYVSTPISPPPPVPAAHAPVTLLHCAGCSTGHYFPYIGVWLYQCHACGRIVDRADISLDPGEQLDHGPTGALGYRSAA